MSDLRNHESNTGPDLAVTSDSNGTEHIIEPKKLAISRSQLCPKIYTLGFKKPK